jgi:hypothetical protein
MHRADRTQVTDDGLEDRPLVGWAGREVFLERQGWRALM